MWQLKDLHLPWMPAGRGQEMAARGVQPTSQCQGTAQTQAAPWFQGAQGPTESRQVAAAGATPGLCDPALPPTYAMLPPVILKSPQDPAEST